MIKFFYDFGAWFVSVFARIQGLLNLILINFSIQNLLKMLIYFPFYAIPNIHECQGKTEKPLNQLC